MKKLIKYTLAGLTILTFVFLLGFYLGGKTARVPITVTVAPNSASPVSDSAEAYLININTAGKAMLMTLPGIGETTALRIIEWRETHGPFPDVEALLNIQGIGSKTLEEILDYITIGG